LNNLSQQHMILNWVNEQTDYEISEETIKLFEQIILIVVELEKIGPSEVSLTIVDDAKIHSLNQQYRGIDQVTDVLSFSMLELSEDESPIIYEDEDTIIPLGDIVISIERALEQSQTYDHSLQRELGFLFTHGLLHLLGYDHQDEQNEQIMFAKQEFILQKAGLTR
jgi:probable rRNA maturation factor